MIRSNGGNIRIERGSSGNNFSIQNNGALNIGRNSTLVLSLNIQEVRLASATQVQLK